MEQQIFLIALTMPLATILLIFGMRYFALVMQAKANQQSSASQQDLLDALAEIKSRLTAIETVLKDVA